MTLTIGLLLLILAFICFVSACFPIGRLPWVSMGLALWVLSQILS